MNITLTIDNDGINKLLTKYKYTTEEILVYYPLVHDVDYGKMYTIVAYPKGKRPKVLDEDQIMMEDVKDYILETVVNRLFNETLLEKLMI